MKRIFAEDKELLYYLHTGKLAERDLFGDIPPIPENSKNLKDRQNYVFSLMKFNPEERRQQLLLPELDTITDEQVEIQKRVREIIEEEGLTFSEDINAILDPLKMI